MAFALSATLSVAYSTPRPDMLFTSSRPLSPAPLPEFRRTDADFLEGVHSEPSQPLTQRVLERGMPHRARTPNEQTSRRARRPHVTALQCAQTGLLLTRLSLAVDSA